MAIKRKDIKMYIEKAMIFCIRTTYRFSRDHPFVFGLVLFLLVLYRSFPCLFVFLVSSSPVIVCTTLLLGLLLSYGEPNIPEIEEEDKRTWEVSSMKIGSSANHLCVEEDENLTVENHVDNRTHIEEIASWETVLHKEKASADDDICQATKQYEGNTKLGTIMDASLSDEEVKKESYNEYGVVQEKEIQGEGVSKDKDLYVGKLGVGVAEVGINVSAFGFADKQETEGPKLGINDPALDHHFDSSLGLPWQSIATDHNSSDTESDRAESSSPDASMADIIPMLDELHPLLNSDHPQHVSMSKADAASEGSLLDHETDDISIDEEVENNGEEEDDQEEKDDGTEAAVKWTEDDQKNVMDLGSSELERNRRLESLMAKRRARKNLTFVIGRNLIDLDTNDSFLGIEELSRLRVQVPPISAPRRNPFDTPYDSEETIDLPPIPGSAPSSLLPRRNPFDLFYDQQEQDSNLTGEMWDHQDFVSAPHREMLFRRNETFSLGRRELQQERCLSRLKPYFSSEKMDPDEGSSSTFQRQFSDKSESKVSSIPESDTVSSVTDQEYKRELEEQEFHQETELSSLADAVDHESQNSEEVESVDIEEKKAKHLANDLEIDLDANHIIQENDQVVERFRAVEEDISEEIDLNLPISDSEKLEVIEQKHDELNSSSSDEDEKVLETTFSELSSNLEQARNLRQSAFAESDYLTRVDQVYDYKVAEPVYESNPPAAGNSLSKLSTLDEALPDAGQVVNANSSVKFDLQKEVSEVGSSPSQLEGNVAPGIGDMGSVNASMEELASISAGPFKSFQSSLSTDENKSRSREITDASLHDDVEVRKSAAQEDSSHLIPCMIQEPTAVDSINDTNFSSLMARSSEADPIDGDVNRGIEGEEVIETTLTSYSDILLLSDDSSSSEFQKALPSVEKYSLSSDAIGVEESGVTLDLPSVSEEKQEGFKQKEEDPCFTNHDQVVGLTGLQINEELKVLGSDIEQEISFFQKSRQETSRTDDNDKLVHKPEDSTSIIFPAVAIHYGGLTGLQLIKLTESNDSSIVSEMHSEIRVQSSSDLSKSREGIKSAVLTKHETGSLKMVDSSDEESDEVHPVVLETDEMDESLPTEMDEAADFHIDELLSNHRGSDMMCQMNGESEDNVSGSSSSFVHDYTQLQFSEDRSTLYTDMSVNQPSTGSFSKSQEVHSAVSQPRVMESEIGSSFGSSGNLKQTVYDPKIHVLEQSLVQEVDSASNQLLEEAMVSIVSESNTDKPITAKLVIESSEIDTAQRNMKQTMMDSDLLVVEARSIEDIHSPFKQISEESLDKSLYHEVGSQNSQGTVHLDAKQIQSDLHFVEAKNIEDLDMAFGHLSHSTGKKVPKAIETIDGSLEDNASEGQLDNEVLEVQSSDEISLAIKEPAASDTSSSMELFGEKSEAELVGVVSSSRTSTSRRTQKKHKRRNSVSRSRSRSRSSSSSSDSGFHENKQE